MKLAKSEVDDATHKVVESEGLVVKLEQEIIEWNALRKLIKRDEELDEVEAAVKEMLNNFKLDRRNMEDEERKVSKKLEKEKDQKAELERLMQGVQEYFGELDQILGLINGIKEEKDQCFTEFSDEVPNDVKLERQSRKKTMAESSSRKSFKKGQAPQLSPTSKIEFDPSKENMDMYEMLSINCKFKKPIKKLLKNVERVKMAKAALDDKHGPLKEKLSKLKSPPVYQPVKGDQVDELFAHHLNASGLAVPVKRIAAGKYMFGTK